MSSLRRSTPSQHGVRASGIMAFLDALERRSDVDPHGLMILRHGAVVAEGWWAPYTAHRVQLLYSVSKTFLSTAVGFAVAEGLFSLDDAIADHFPEFRDGVPAASRAIRIRDALAMASGHDTDMATVAIETDPVEPVRGFLLHAPEHEPGTWFAYNQLATFSVATILQRAAGTDLVDYLRPRLLDPLGIGPVSWQQYPPGRSLGFSGLFATVEAIAKLGQLHLDDGRWEGVQLLPEKWAAEVRTRRVATDSEPNPDWRQGYGYQVWLSRHGYRADGAYGQFCLVLPAQGAVVALTSASQDTQSVLDAVWQHLLPAFAETGDGTHADELLADRLRSLSLRPTEGDVVAAAVVPDEWAGQGLTARRVNDGAIALSDGAVTVELNPASGWVTSEGDATTPPVAVSGGWSADAAHLDVLFLESPHRLYLDLWPDGSLSHEWVTAPLLGFQPGAPILGQQAPRPLR